MTDPSDIEGLTLHELSAEDAHRGFLLSTEIGWNQTENDWAYMLANGLGVGMTDASGKLVASALVLPYGSFGWVCMVLVAPDWRRRGIATDLMNRVIGLLRDDGVVPGLDATPAGREVYRQIGFLDVYGLERLIAGKARLRAKTPPGTELRPLSADDLKAVAVYDRAIFAGEREELLRHLHGREPGRAFGAWRNGELSGFVLARDGRTWTQIGPVIAEDYATAKALIVAAGSGGKGPTALLIDMMDYHSEVVAWLKTSGFEYQRPYIRMIHGSDQPLDAKQKVFSPAGPELG